MKGTAMLKFKLTGVAIIAALLVGCGGGGDSDDGGGGGGGSGGASGPITADEIRANEAALSAKATVGSYMESQNPFIGGIVPPTSSATSGLSYKSQPVTTETETRPGECGGSQTFTVRTETTDTTVYPITVDLDGTWSNYCIGQPSQNITLNGTYDAHERLDSPGNGFSSLGYDATYTANIPIFPVSGRIAFHQDCTTVNTVRTCSRSTQHRTTGGTLYTLRSSASLTGSSSSGYGLLAALESSTGRTYAVSASGLTRCSNGNFQTGTIQLTDQTDNRVFSISFSNCASASVTYLGNSWTTAQ
jgi:hypothetical protein